jgi:serine/threonine protein kinase
MLIYESNGDFITRPLFDGPNIFRKMTNNINEKTICTLLKKNPHKNIVKIFDIKNNYIDMELLNTNINMADIDEIIKVMKDVQIHLHKLGIMYIDWKLDNIGIDCNMQYKLFDFNVSGLINIETNEWIIEPPKYWYYNKAVKNGMKNPIDIDNYAFGHLVI